MDISAVSSALSSVFTAANIAKLIKDSGATLEKAEMKLKLAELISALADAKISISEIQDLLLTKDAEIRSLREDLQTKGDVRWEAPYYWLKTASGEDGLELPGFSGQG